MEENIFYRKIFLFFRHDKKVEEFPFDFLLLLQYDPHRMQIRHPIFNHSTFISHYNPLTLSPIVPQVLLFLEYTKCI